MVLSHILFWTENEKHYTLAFIVLLWQDRSKKTAALHENWKGMVWLQVFIIISLFAELFNVCQKFYKQNMYIFRRPPYRRRKQTHGSRYLGSWLTCKYWKRFSEAASIPANRRVKERMLGLGSGSASTEVMNSVRQGLSCTSFTVGSSNRVLPEKRPENRGSLPGLLSSLITLSLSWV